MEQQLWQQVDQFMQQELARLGFPAAYGVVAGGEVVVARGVGLADRRSREPVTPATLFEIGSVTKSLTATAILQLRDRGLLELDAPVQRYLPWFRVSDPVASGEITLRHLLNHTSGLPPVAQGVAARDYDRIWPSLEEAVRALDTVRLASRPGVKFSYSNMGYATLGAVVEAVSGQTWAAYIEGKIMVPLSMTRSVADLHQADLPVATPHRWVFCRPAPVGHRALGPCLAPAGSVTACSVLDLAHYLAAHMGQVPLPGLSAASLEEAHTGAAVMGGKMAYGLGWVDQGAEEGERVVWHNGGTEGSSSIVMFLPAAGVGVVLLTNRATRLVDQLGARMIEVLRGKEPKPVKGGPEPFMLISLVATGMALAALGLLLWLGWTVLAEWGSPPAAWGRAAGFGAVAAGAWYVALRELPRTGLTPLYRFWLWPADMLLGICGMLLSLTLWTLYGLTALLL